MFFVSNNDIIANNMMTNTKFDQCIEGLKGSSMFYMSLGSKELFHSNFLYWLYVVCPEYFVKVMHSLANVEKFWWEDSQYTIDVRREDKNFDLSVWLLVSKEQEPEYWISVLVLENKMKSLPYREQLEEYVGKVTEVWRNSKLVKSNLKSDPTWIDKHNVTLILLSLLEPTNKGELTEPIGENISNIEVKYRWESKTYNDLVISLKALEKQAIESIVLESKFFHSIIDDYCRFVGSLFTIANEDWKITGAENYLEKVCPKSLSKGEDKRRIVILDSLRIADIREKIIYDQLLSILEESLKKLDSNVKRVKKELLFDIYKGKPIDRNENRILCRTNYFHKIGLFEAMYMIRGKGNSNDEPFYFTIQIQGKDYTHGLQRKNIVGTNTIIKDGKPIKTNCIGKLSPNGKDMLQDMFFDFGNDDKFYKYGNSFIYQKRQIEQKHSIQDVIAAVVGNIEKIRNSANNLQENDLFL